MAVETIFVLQPFVKAKKGGRVILGRAVQLADERAAKRALATVSDSMVGAVVFATKADRAAGEWGETTIYDRCGEVPEVFLETLS